MNVILFLQMASTAFVFVSLVYSVFKRSSRALSYIIFGEFLGLVMNIASYGLMSSLDRGQAKFWYCIFIAAVVYLLPTITIICAIGTNSPLPRSVRVVYYFCAAFMAIFMTESIRNGSYVYSYIAFRRENGLSYLQRTYGDFHIVFWLYMAFFCAAASAICLYCLIIKKNKNYQYLHLLAIPVMPLAFYLIDKFLNLRVEIVAFSVPAICVLVDTMLYDHFFNLESVAVRHAYKKSETGYIITDEYGYIIEANDVAKKIFTGISAADNGRERLSGLSSFAPYYDTLARGENSPFVHFEGRDYQIRREMLANNFNNALAGVLYTIEDRTDALKLATLEEGYQNELIADAKEKTEKLQKEYEKMVNSFAFLAKNRNMEEEKGVGLPMEIASIIMDRLKKSGNAEITESFTDTTRIASALYDIGMIRVPDSIIKKPDPLTEEERAKMREHTVYGVDMLKNIFSENDFNSYYTECVNAIKYHHEWWDGSGYPNGISGTEIPLAARIIAVVDSFTAMISERPYRTALTFSEAVDEIINERGTHFDPIVVDAFSASRRDIKALISKSEEGGE